LKNQNDLIVCIAAAVIGLTTFLIAFFTKREPTKPADPTPVVTSEAKPQEGAVTYADSLPGGGQSSGSSFGGGGAASGGSRGASAPGVAAKGG
jgi:hypothetical protein